VESPPQQHDFFSGTSELLDVKLWAVAGLAFGSIHWALFGWRNGSREDLTRALYPISIASRAGVELKLDSEDGGWLDD
jgi:hypothetical protein